MTEDNFNEQYYISLAKCGNRYLQMFPLHLEDCSPADIELWKFIIEFRNGIEDQLPLMKLNRWLGYIQGLLIERGYTTVQEERDWTRPLFRPLDFQS